MRRLRQGSARVVKPGISLVVVVFAAVTSLPAQNPGPRPATAPGVAGGYAYPSRPPADPASVARGKVLYDTNCSFCHGEDARGGGAVLSGAIHVPPVSVTVTLADGQKVEGRLGRVDDFIVTLTEADGTARSFRRDGDAPKVEVHDPMQPHKDLLRVYSDKDIHDVTAYLVTIK